MDRRLGGPLPHQLANPTRAHPIPINLSPCGRIRYYSEFPRAIPNRRARSHVLLTRLPLPLRGARLACVRPAASVRSEPGSNSQVGLETLNRLITTFDEVPPFLVSRSRQPPAIHIAGSDGVTLFKTCTAEVFRPIPRNESTKPSSGSRSARTPPSTFLSLHLHLSNSPGSENPSPVDREQPRPKSS